MKTYKSNKGFTLIELLAVIIVLAVVTLLAVQAILPQVDKAKKNAFAVEANNAIDAAKQWYAEAAISGTTLTKKTSSCSSTTYSACYCVKIKTLIDNGFFEGDNNKHYGYAVILLKKANDSAVYQIVMTDGVYTTRASGNAATKTDASALHTGKISTDKVNSSQPEVGVAGSNVKNIKTDTTYTTVYDGQCN